MNLGNIWSLTKVRLYLVHPSRDTDFNKAAFGGELTVKGQTSTKSTLRKVSHFLWFRPMLTFRVRTQAVGPGLSQDVGVLPLGYPLWEEHVAVIALLHLTARKIYMSRIPSGAPQTHETGRCLTQYHHHGIITASDPCRAEAKTLAFTTSPFLPSLG